MDSTILLGSMMVIFVLGLIAYVLWDEKRQKTKSK